MNPFRNFLIDFFLVKNFNAGIRRLGGAIAKGVTNLQKWLNNVKPFSWEAMLLLSLFSWFVYLLVRGFYVKRFISSMAWLFLIVAVDWALLRKQILLPLLGFKLSYGPWVAGALTCIALLSNDFILSDWRSALISWPIISAVFAGYSKFIRPGFVFQLPTPEGIQELTLLFLINGLISSWFQFHFLIQDLLQTYPNLLADRFDNSAFVTRLNADDRPATQGYQLADITEATVRQGLTGQNWDGAKRWLEAANQPATEADLSRQIVKVVYGDRLPREQELWQITLDPSFGPSQIDLPLRIRWLGPSSRANGYVLKRACLVSQVAPPPPQTFEEMQRQTSGFQLTCQPTQEEVQEG